MLRMIDEIYTQRNEFIVIGLTGKIGSGCTTVAKFLASSQEDLNLPPKSLGKDSRDKDRKKHVIHEFFKKNWHPFVPISARDIITTFILEQSFDEVKSYLTQKFGTIDIDDARPVYEKFSEQNKRFVEAVSDPDSHETDAEFVYDYIVQDLPPFTDTVKGKLEVHSYRNFSSVFQLLGDNIRKCGTAIPGEEDPKHIYAIARRLNQTIKLLRRANGAKKRRDYFVIDSFRNPFEVAFFQERFAAFYLFAIKSPEDHRLDRLITGLKLNIDDIKAQDDKEDSPKSPIKTAELFVSQHIRACIQKADVHIQNLGKYGQSNFVDLKGQMVKYISLVQHPGLVTPSSDEKMMQIAFTAKSNSGCISRQVGAVVVNPEGALVSVGWNDVPEGQISCRLRSMDTLISHADDDAYSRYEREDNAFRAQLSKAREAYPALQELGGRLLCYCFKDIQNALDDEKNQVHTRALHAEENAFLQVAKHGGEPVKGGTLYTTASPCELCSKKAYQLGIKKIVYIEPYPGIAAQNVIESGSHHVKVELYQGAIGYAYHKLYEPILPYKDELNALHGA